MTWNLSQDDKDEINFTLKTFAINKIALRSAKKSLMKVCRRCVQTKCDTCNPSSDNGCEVRQYLTKITKALNGSN